MLCRSQAKSQYSLVFLRVLFRGKKKKLKKNFFFVLKLGSLCMWTNVLTKQDLKWTFPLQIGVANVPGTLFPVAETLCAKTT